MTDAELVRLQQAVQAHPQDKAIRLSLLHGLVAAERWDEAEEVGAVLLQDEAPLATVHALMGIVYGKRQRWDEAVQQCRHALAAQPDDALVLLNLGTLLAQQGDLKAAHESLDKAVTHQDGWAEAHYALGTVLLRQERYTEAIRAFERALKRRTTYPEAQFNRGNAHAMKGLDPEGTLDYYELDCAINAYKTAIQQRPGYTAALYNLGMLYKRMTSSEGLRVWDQYLEAAREVPGEALWCTRAQEYKRDLQDRLR
jgi:tetratricopeptide (TPR) repeat protein